MIPYEIIIQKLLDHIYIIQQQIHGIDLDWEAIEIHLWLEIVHWVHNIIEILGGDVFKILTLDMVLDLGIIDELLLQFKYLKDGKIERVKNTEK